MEKIVNKDPYLVKSKHTFIRKYVGKLDAAAELCTNGSGWTGHTGRMGEQSRQNTTRNFNFL
jgi:hypothetical protein